MAYVVNYNNKFFRVHAVTVDKWGIDPLMDQVIPRLMQIPTYTNHAVTADERGAPDLISLREYSTEDYWWHIMAYNGIGRYQSIVEGMTLRIPELSSIISVTNDASLSNRNRSTGQNIATI